MIYFIQAGENGPIKIGFVEDANKINLRLSKMQTDNYEKLSVIGLIDGTVREEKTLHEKFKMNNIRSEWFECTQELKNFILHHPGKRSIPSRKRGRPTKGAATRLPIDVYYTLKCESEKLRITISEHFRNILRGFKPDLPWDQPRPAASAPEAAPRED